MTIELKTTRWQRGRDSAPTAVESTLATTVGAAPTQLKVIEGYRGGCIRFFSNGADNETATVTIYNVNQDASNGWQVESLGSVALTFGTSTGVLGTIARDGDIMTGTMRWADTCVWTASTYGTAMLTRVGGNIAAFSPADNTIAELMVSDFGSPMGIAMVVTTFGLTAARALMPVIRLEV